ncbi:MAG: polysaccharide biosynthesis tyrosine autokinase [Verrucomicrobiota bacterium]
MKEDLAFDIDIRLLFNLVLERIWLLIVSLVLFVALGIAYIVVSPKLYKATALIEVPVEAANVVAIEDVANQDFRSLEVLRTIEQSLLRRSLFKQVMERKEIFEDDRLLVGLGLAPEDVTTSLLSKMLASWTDVSLRRGTRLIEVSVEHRDPEMAAVLSNAIVSAYVNEKIGSRSGSSQTAFSFLYDEAQRVRAKLQQSEDALQDFQRAVDIREKIETQEDEVNLLEQRYRDKHPKLIQARSLLSNFQADFQRELLKVSSQLKEKEFWKQKAESFEELSGEDRMAAELKLMEAQFNVLTREVEADRVLYDSIVTRMKETDVTRGIKSNPIEVVDEAQVPALPSKPQKFLILALSAFLGGSCGLGIIFFLHLLDNTIKTVDDAEEIIGLPVLGAVPDDNRIPDVDWMKKEGKRILARLKESANKEEGGAETSSLKKKKSDGKMRKIEPLVLLSDSGSHTSEAIRSLRASVKLLGPEEERKTFMVTSAVPGEGKSFVASNLALSFAQEGRNTLLIDADLRRPMVDKIFAIPFANKMSGIVGFLAGQGDFESALYDPHVECLRLLPVGKMAPNPAELLAGPTFEALLKKASETYDRVIVDSAPVNSVSDSLIVAPLIQSIILVAHASKTPKNAILRAKEQLGKAKKIPVGLVLNRLPSKSGLNSDPYYYYYAAGDGYGRAYGER